MKIITIVGARPQFIKAVTVSRELEKADIREVIIHTGQHYDSNMSEIFFKQMHIPIPKYTLGVSGISHGAMTGRMLEKIEKILIDEKPDWMLVYGDTNSTLAGALAASKLHIPVAHVEAGLRSFNMRMPEEQNRALVDRLSSILFCPTETAVRNLHNEGFDDLNLKVINVGDVMQDAAIYYNEMAKVPSSLNSEVLESKFVLATVHRAENTDDIARLKSIIEALNLIHQECAVVIPLHPRTQAIIRQEGIQLNVNVIDPIGYLEMIYLLKKCQIVLTDSGGLQKEAFFFSKPCVTLRDETEWVELILGKFNTLAGSKCDKIYNSYLEMKDKVIIDSKNLYGGGKAARKIVSVLQKYSE